ncbi:MAG: hypothetical protein A3J29_20100 [Acidobacteria bacterium RIFCSPLOWO2_12_FULL_67_14b]|nr:MAG: hypothetical protein A3J29_20100 [Acidobacteria bacterium RIFCSPLOWO2_12_FULL_67_14b]
MNADRDRDRLLEDALRHELGRAIAPATAACLDAETLAAWTDGGLDAQAAAMAEAHVSSCARCQALVGTLARAVPVTAGGARGVTLWRWWLAPIAATAAAVTLWMVMPDERRPADIALPERAVVEPPQASARVNQATPVPATPAPAAPAAAPDAAKEAVTESGRVAATFGETKRKDEALMKADKPEEARDRAEPRAAEEQAAAAAPPVAQLRMQQRALGEVVGADGSRRWRAGARAAVEYSDDGGRTWQPVSPPIEAEITASASPSPTICWLVGRAGVVLLTIDGRTFSRIPSPDTADLIAVTATDARSATVTTSDGRSFRTDDAGKTWRRQ